MANLAEQIAKMALQKAKGKKNVNFADLGKDLLAALEGKNHEQVGKLLRDQVRIAVNEAMNADEKTE